MRSDPLPSERRAGRDDPLPLPRLPPGERRHPEIINGSRRLRVARGSGTTVQDVNRLLKQFTQTKKMLKKLGSGPMMQGLPPGLGR